MGGLIREARDMQGIRKDVAPPKKDGPAAPPAPEGDAPAGGGAPRKKS